MNNVVTRSISGLVYVAAIVCAIFLGEIPFLILTSVFTILGIREYTIMAHAPYSDRPKYTGVMLVDTAGALLISLSAAIVMYGYTAITLLVFILMLSLYILARASLSLVDTQPRAYREVAKSVFGVLYIALPMFLLNFIYCYDHERARWLIFLMFVMIWLNDTGAFCFGSTFGKHRLCERLSPKKSWEGFWGGLGCCIAFGIICYYTLNYINFSLIAWITLSILISLFSTWGDLFESMLKRTVKVKDSGNMIPGHGGILDRIDSLLFVAPVTCIYYIILLWFIG